jgi:hypothetical protein
MSDRNMKIRRFPSVPLLVLHFLRTHDQVLWFAREKRKTPDLREHRMIVYFNWKGLEGFHSSMNTSDDTVSSMSSINTSDEDAYESTQSRMPGP